MNFRDFFGTLITTVITLVFVKYQLHLTTSDLILLGIPSFVFLRNLLKLKGEEKEGK
jgi:hypothetical protein